MSLIKRALMCVLLVAIVGAGVSVATAWWGRSSQTDCRQPDGDYLAGCRLRAVADRVVIANWKRALLLRAIDRFSASLVKCPANTSAYISRGVAYCDVGEYDQAVADYDAYLRIYPDSADAIKNRGIAYEAQGKLGEALADYELFLRLIADAPGERRAWERATFAERVEALRADAGRIIPQQTQ